MASEDQGQVVNVEVVDEAANMCHTESGLSLAPAAYLR